MNLTTYDNLPPDYGCSKEEIAEIEERQQATCPATYAKILTRVGKIIGSPWEGLYMSYPDILEFKQQLTELLDDLGRTVEIPNDAFVISHYQGFSFPPRLCLVWG